MPVPPSTYNKSRSDNEPAANLSELKKELDALKATSASLEAYLQQVRSLRMSLVTVAKNYAFMDQVNIEWLDVLEKCKEMGVA